MIRLDQVCLEYVPEHGPPHPALRDVDLEVAPGEFFCVLGPSGCGKTSLVNLVAGFVRPTSGRVLFNGHPVEQPGPDRGVVCWSLGVLDIAANLAMLALAMMRQRKLQASPWGSSWNRLALALLCGFEGPIRRAG